MKDVLVSRRKVVLGKRYRRIVSLTWILFFSRNLKIGF